MTTTYVKTEAGNLFALDPRAGWVLIPTPQRFPKLRAAWLRITGRGGANWTD